MTDALQHASWTAAELGVAVAALVRASGLVAAPVAVEGAPGAGEEAAWLVDAAARLGVEIVETSVRFDELGDMLRRLGPSLLRVPGGRFLAVLRGGGRRLQVLVPAGGVQAIDRRLVGDALSEDLLAPAMGSARAVFDGLGLGDAARDDALRAFAREQVGDAAVTGCWLLRPAPASPLLGQMRAARVPLLLAVMLVARVGATAMMLVMWGLVGGALLSGDPAAAPLSLWALCLLSVIPLRMLAGWAEGRMALVSGAVLKEALLHGILNLDRSAMRTSGVGQFMGMTMEGENASTAVESSLAVFAALLDLLAALLVLALGATGVVHVALFVGWIALTAWLIRRYIAQAVRWTAIDRAVTNDLVERLIGYQTRLVQERPERRHADEDRLLCDYLATAQELDRRNLLLDGVIRPGWVLLGVAALAPVLLSGAPLDASTAVAIGGVLMVGQALDQIVRGVAHLADVWVSWQQTAPILQAGRRGSARDAEIRSALSGRTSSRPADAPLLRFSDLSLRHGPDRPEVLRGCSQEIHAGDRVLLEGPSGGGKSTLAALLAGLHRPDRGAMALWGQPFTDLPPEHWRGRVVLVSQFQDNHILTDSLLFNLLLGRCWPPGPGDARAAEAVCERLGLGPLLQRMPQGLAQTVGDGGWALSHGERSRVFLARALLQRDVALVILDESFAALDPETLRGVCRGVLEAAPTLLVIAHP